MNLHIILFSDCEMQSPDPQIQPDQRVRYYYVVQLLALIMKGDT